jgi:hypothetical protein
MLERKILEHAARQHIVRVVVSVDEAGDHQHPAGFDDLGLTCRQAWSYRGDRCSLDQNVAHRGMVEVGLEVKNAPAANQD